jgi:hypothetical protein
MIMSKRTFTAGFAAVSLLAVSQCALAAEINEARPVVGYSVRSILEFISVDSFIKISVGLLALILLAISVLVYLRERRVKFLALTLAFLFFALKGILGLMDLFHPRDSSFLIPFSDSFDLAILLLFFIAVIKD